MIDLLRESLINAAVGSLGATTFLFAFHLLRGY